MKVRIVTDIAVEPLTLEEVKEALKVSGSGHDTELERLMTDARVYIERAIDTSVSERELEVTNDKTLEEWELPFGPISDLVLTYGTDWETNTTYIYTYTGGEVDCPAEIKRLITMLIKHWYDIDDEAIALPEAIKKEIQLRTRQPGL
jgi:hypothetical protein